LFEPKKPPPVAEGKVAVEGARAAQAAAAAASTVTTSAGEKKSDEPRLHLNQRNDSKDFEDNYEAKVSESKVPEDDKADDASSGVVSFDPLDDFSADVYSEVFDSVGSLRSDFTGTTYSSSSHDHNGSDDESYDDDDDDDDDDGKRERKSRGESAGSDASSEGVGGESKRLSGSKTEGRFGKSHNHWKAARREAEAWSEAARDERRRLRRLRAQVRAGRAVRSRADERASAAARAAQAAADKAARKAAAAAMGAALKAIQKRSGEPLPMDVAAVRRRVPAARLGGSEPSAQRRSGGGRDSTWRWRRVAMRRQGQRAAEGDGVQVRVTKKIKY
jgi:hypothetical protein